jgi:methionyl-tRNA synthetase
MANDHDFSIDKMKLRYRKSLLGQYGNLLERITSLKLCPDSTIHADVNVQLRDGHLRDVLSELPMQVESDYEQGEVAQALRKIAHALVVANQYVSHNQPWHASHDDRQSIVYHASEATRLAALLLSPVTPTTSLRVLNRLGIHDLGWKHAHLDAVKDTRKVVQNGLLFPKLD